MKSVVVCTSKRFKNEVAEFCGELEKKGVMVFEPNFEEVVGEEDFIQSHHLTKVVFKGLTLEHFNWITKAEVCYVYNKEDYCGVSVAMEMAYATALKKPIFALSSRTGDPCRDALIDKVVPTVDELVRLLG